MSQRGEYRAVFSVIIDTEEFQALSPNARLLWFTIKMSLSASGIGLLFDDQLRARSGLTQGRMEAARAELIEGRWLILEGRVHWLRNGLKYEPHMSLTNDNHRSFIAKEIRGLPRLRIVRQFATYYSLPDPTEGVENYGLGDGIPDGMGDGMPDHTTPLPTPTPIPTPGSKTVVGSRKKSAMPTHSPEFAVVWSLHPRGSKAKALAEYQAAVPDRIDHTQLVACLTKYVNTEINDRFRGHDLFRWIRDGRWEEYLNGRRNGGDPSARLRNKADEMAAYLTRTGAE